MLIVAICNAVIGGKDNQAITQSNLLVNELQEGGNALIKTKDGVLHLLAVWSEIFADSLCR